VDGRSGITTDSFEFDPGAGIRVEEGVNALVGLAEIGLLIDKAGVFTTAGAGVGVEG
jgi:hypothetical protein